jgi:hypothetical protein
MTDAWRWLIPRAACCATLLVACPASAASPGSVGGSAQGSISISVSIRPPAKVAGLSDFAFDGAGSSPAPTATRDVCFTGAARSYTVAASGSGPGGTLSLSNGSDSIAYRVEWLPLSGQDTAAPLSGEEAVTVSAADNASQCGPQRGAGQLRIALDSAGTRRVQDGAPYTGSLILTLTPD